MDVTDILIYETGDGGDILLRGNDMASVGGYENTVYLAMFGGSSWWGNFMVPPEQQYNCVTEDVLNTTPLTSQGRVLIENAIKTDLAYLSSIPGTTTKVTTTITNANRIEINIDINGQQFNYVWNPDKMYLSYQIG